MELLQLLFCWVFGWIKTHGALLAENLALRQQVAVYSRTAKKPRLRRGDRLFWVVLSIFRRSLDEVNAPAE